MGDRDSENIQRRAALQALDWLRETWPDARLNVDAIASDDALIPVRVTIDTGAGAVGAGHGAAPGVEEAEDRAIVRAAESLGYRVAAPVEESAPTLADEPPPAPAPVEPIETVTHTPNQPRAGRSAQLGPAVVTRPRATGGGPSQAPARSAEPPARRDEPPVVEPDDDRELEMEDVSWTAFWKWARAQGYETGEKVANAIGRPIQGLTPREVRDLLRSQL